MRDFISNVSKKAFDKNEDILRDLRGMQKAYAILELRCEEQLHILKNMTKVEEKTRTLGFQISECIVKQ